MYPLVPGSLRELSVTSKLHIVILMDVGWTIGDLCMGRREPQPARAGPSTAGSALTTTLFQNTLLLFPKRSDRQSSRKKEAKQHTWNQWIMGAILCHCQSRPNHHHRTSSLVQSAPWFDQPHPGLHWSHLHVKSGFYQDRSGEKQHLGSRHRKLLRSQCWWCIRDGVIRTATCSCGKMHCDILH